MRIKGVIAALVLLLLCTTPLASAAFGDDVTAEATGPAGAVVTFDDGGSNCSPPSGSQFALGDTPVECTGGGPPTTFTVHVVDTTPPLVTVPSDITTPATSSSGAVVNYSPAPNASDIVDVSVPVTCSPVSGSMFQPGTTPVTCSATDSNHNTGSASFNVIVGPWDSSGPTIGVPGTITAEATGPGGASVSYTVNFSDPNGVASSSCTPASGSTFTIGPHTVTCNATDNNGNSSSAPFTINVVDSTGPVISNVPANVTREATSGSGAAVTFTNPTANDAVSGPAPVNCSPTSGSLFPLGVSTVTCSATDSGGHSSNAAFQVTVHDTTPPELLVPNPHTVYATSAAGVSDSDPNVVAFINAASAADIVDPHPVVGSNIHALVPVGQTIITFFARDFSGNSVSRDVLLTVLPPPVPGAPALPPPVVASRPGNVTRLVATPKDGRIVLTWRLPANCDHVVLSRSASDGTGEQVIYLGNATSFTDRGLQNGVEYRYVVRCADAAGNRSAGVAVLATPMQDRLRSPKDGARLRKPPKLMWTAEPDADYYNVQLFRNGTRILAVWPRKPAFTLKKTWKYTGRTYKLRAGTYQWYVWPGFGARKAVDYGPLLGVRTFSIRP